MKENKFNIFASFKEIEDPNFSQNVRFLPAPLWKNLIFPKLDLRDLLLFGATNRTMYTLVSRYNDNISLEEVETFTNLNKEELKSLLTYLSRRMKGCKTVKEKRRIV